VKVPAAEGTTVPLTVWVTHWPAGAVKLIISQFALVIAPLAAL
jgi:hypothetical protein